MKKHFILGTLILSLTLLLISCYTPSPLYGTWSDNNGNKLVFMTDGSFTARVKNDLNETIDYDGTYTVIDNVLVFTYDGKSRNSVWDLNGAVLKLTWSIDDTVKNLILYHTAR